jgi:hypothetical protein
MGLHTYRLEGVGDEDAAAAEGPLLVPRHARLKVVGPRRAGGVVDNLLLTAHGEVEEQRRRHHQHVGRDAVPRHAHLALLDRLPRG